jgi:hypothetical protein
VPPLRPQAPTSLPLTLAAQGPAVERAAAQARVVVITMFRFS